MLRQGREALMNNLAKWRCCGAIWKLDGSINSTLADFDGSISMVGS
jgi:hypothetical protein